MNKNWQNLCKYKQIACVYENKVGLSKILQKRTLKQQEVAINWFEKSGKNGKTNLLKSHFVGSIYLTTTQQLMHTQNLDNFFFKWQLFEGLSRVTLTTFNQRIKKEQVNSSNPVEKWFGDKGMEVDDQLKKCSEGVIWDVRN